MKKGDLIIVAVVMVILAALGIGYKIYLNRVGTDRYVYIYVNGKLYESENGMYNKPIKLTKDIDITIPVEQIIDGKKAYNIVHIHNNGVEVEEANCPNQDDVHQGFVSSPGIDIICLPHNLRVVIKGGTSNSDDIAS